MSFSTIPVRSNAREVLASWFNLLRTAGIALETFLGTGYLTETQFTIANNQPSLTNVTGLLFSSASVKSAAIFATVRRSTDSNELISTGLLKVYYRPATTDWAIIDELGGDNDDGVEFSITSAGQVQYTSSNVAGTGYSGTMVFKAIVMGV